VAVSLTYAEAIYHWSGFHIGAHAASTHDLKEGVAGFSRQAQAELQE